VGIRLEDAEGLSSDDGRRIAASFAKALQDTTGISSVVDERMWEEDCDKRDRCGAEIRGRTGARELVLLKAYGAATRFRLIAERVDDHSVVLRSVQADLSRDDRTMDRGLKGFVEILFPSEARSATVALPVAGTSIELARAASASDSSAGKLVAWSAMGAGVVTAGVATVLRISSNSTRSSLEKDPLTPDQIKDDMSKVRTFSTLSNLLFGVGAVLFTGGLVYLLDH
jgi:hypothetical protein